MFIGDRIQEKFPVAWFTVLQACGERNVWLLYTSWTIRCLIIKNILSNIYHIAQITLKPSGSAASTFHLWIPCLIKSRFLAQQHHTLHVILFPSADLAWLSLSPNYQLPSMPTATTTITKSSRPPKSFLPPLSSLSPQPMAAQQTSKTTALNSLYNRAALAFVLRDIALTYSLLQSGFALLNPPTIIIPDSLSEHRRKWDILRITF